MKNKLLILSVFSSCLLLISSCKPLIALYDQYAYTEATSIKVDALNVMDKATEPYSKFNNSVDELNSKLDKAYEYEKHRPANELTTKMWEIIKNPSKNLLGGFLKRWEQKGNLNSEFIKEEKVQVSDAFDMVIELESKKIKSSDKQVQTFLNHIQ
jgi:hypothetical protein